MSLDLYFTAVRETTVGEFNITHNLTRMAREADIYGILWRPEENGIERAGNMIKPLMRGIRLMEENPEYFKQFDAENKWGTYDGFLPWLREVLECCVNNPEAKVETWR